MQTFQDNRRAGKLGAEFFPFLTAIVLMVAVPALGGADDLLPAPLSAFGQHGERVPDAVRQLFPDELFTASMADSLASGQAYVATLKLDDLAQTASASPKGDAAFALEQGLPITRLILIIENLGSNWGDVVISGVGRSGTRNFVLRLEAAGSLVVDATAEANQVERLYLVSAEPFSLRTELERAGQTAELSTSRVAPPSVELASDTALQKGPFYCQSLVKNIQICNSSGGCVVAQAVRSFWYSSPNKDWYKVNIHYPIGGPVFHVHYGSFGAPIIPCKASQYQTFRPSVNFAHRWNGLDDTLFHGTPSTSSCISGCSGFWNVSLY